MKKKLSFIILTKFAYLQNEYMDMKKPKKPSCNAVALIFTIIPGYEQNLKRFRNLLASDC